MSLIVLVLPELFYHNSPWAFGIFGSSIKGVMVSLGVRYWNRQTPFSKILATNSYNLYLSHYIFVIGFQLLLFSLPEIPVLLKFGLVSILIFTISFSTAFAAQTNETGLKGEREL